jgi:hypothetical protein
MQDERVRGNISAKYSGRANGIKFVWKHKSFLQIRHVIRLRKVYSKTEKN